MLEAQNKGMMIQKEAEKIVCENPELIPIIEYEKKRLLRKEAFGFGPAYEPGSKDALENLTSIDFKTPEWQDWYHLLMVS